MAHVVGHRIFSLSVSLPVRGADGLAKRAWDRRSTWSKLRGRKIIVIYLHGRVAIIQPDESFEIARMD